MTDSVRHPIFARVCDRTSASMEREVGSLRDELLSGLRGRVAEVGAGNGAGFAHYPPTVDVVIAVQPEPYLRSKAVEKAAAARVSVCTVPDPGRAIAELPRVVRPGGEIGSSSTCARPAP